MNRLDQEILQFIKKVKSRQQEILVVNFTVYTLTIGFLIACVMGGLSFIMPFYYAIPISIFSICLAFVIGVVIGIMKTPNLEKSALKADEKGLRERVVTAYDLCGKEDYFSVLQKQNAWGMICHFPIRKNFPLHIDIRAVVLLALFCFGFCVLSILPAKTKEQAKAEHEIIKESKEQIKKVNDVLKNIEKISELSEQKKEELKEMLNATRKEFKEANTEQDLKKAEERFQKKLEMAFEKEQKDFAKAFEEAKQALESAKSDNQNQQDGKESAAKELEKLAEELNDAELKEAADSLKNSEGSEQDIAEAKEALEKAEERAREQNEDYASGSEEQDGAGESDSADNGNDSGNGEDSGTENGNGEKSNTGSGKGWDKGNRNGKEGSAKAQKEMVTVPDAEVGNDEDLEGKQNNGGTKYSQKTNQSKTWSGEKKDYNQVKAEYSKRAYNRINSSNYPGSVKDKVKLYFEKLNQ